MYHRQFLQNSVCQFALNDSTAPFLFLTLFVELARLLWKSRAIGSCLRSTYYTQREAGPVLRSLQASSKRACTCRTRSGTPSPHTLQCEVASNKTYCLKCMQDTAMSCTEREGTIALCAVTITQNNYCRRVAKSVLRSSFGRRGSDTTTRDDSVYSYSKHTALKQPPVKQYNAFSHSTRRGGNMFCDFWTSRGVLSVSYSIIFSSNLLQISVTACCLKWQDYKRL